MTPFLVKCRTTKLSALKAGVPPKEHKIKVFDPDWSVTLVIGVEVGARARGRHIEGSVQGVSPEEGSNPARRGRAGPRSQHPLQGTSWQNSRG